MLQCNGCKESFKGSWSVLYNHSICGFSLLWQLYRESVQFGIDAEIVSLEIKSKDMQNKVDGCPKLQCQLYNMMRQNFDFFFFTIALHWMCIYSQTKQITSWYGYLSLVQIMMSIALYFMKVVLVGSDLHLQGLSDELSLYLDQLTSVDPKDIFWQFTLTKFSKRNKGEHKSAVEWGSYSGIYIWNKQIKSFLELLKRLGLVLNQ